MQIFNTMSRQKEEFVPQTPGEYRIYVCGPTVYNYIHIGNARPMIVFDTLRRYLEYCGNKVYYVSNITDIDDKLIKKGQEEGTSMQEVARKFEAEYIKDSDGLNVKAPTVRPRATEHIGEIIHIVKDLVDSGHAYVARNGDVYFRVKSDPGYGKLSHLNLDDLESGNRALRSQMDDDLKEDPADFAVWKAAKPGEPYWESPWDTKEFGRIAAQTARNIIRQGIRDGERGQVMQEFQSRHQELVSALVERIDPRSGAATLRIGKAEAVLPKSEQVGDEELKEGDHVKVYVVDVKETEKGPRAVISRTHPDLVKRLFETEVPEIYDGTVEIKSVSREAGSRTKLAVYSRDPDVDAVGACIGPRGARVGSVVNELGGEKIDIVEYSDDPCKFIASALSPADVLGVEVDPDGQRSCRVTVPDNQLSLAIGNKGQNARLAAKLTGWKIDIRPESGFYGE